MHCSDNPTEFLKALRLKANKITSSYEKNKKVDANICVMLAQEFEELDQHLAEGGDAPEQWAPETDTSGL
jgi:hypothetical protein